MKAGTSLVRRSSRHRSASVDAADGPSDGPTRSNARQASRGTRSKAKTGKKGTKATRSASVDVLNDENTAEEGAGGTRGKNHAPPKSALTRTYSTTRRANALSVLPANTSYESAGMGTPLEDVKPPNVTTSVGGPAWGFGLGDSGFGSPAGFGTRGRTSTWGTVSSSGDSFDDLDDRNKTTKRCACQMSPTDEEDVDMEGNAARARTLSPARASFDDPLGLREPIQSTSPVAKKPGAARRRRAARKEPAEDVSVSASERLQFAIHVANGLQKASRKARSLVAKCHVPMPKYTGELRERFIAYCLDLGFEPPSGNKLALGKDKVQTARSTVQAIIDEAPKHHRSVSSSLASSQQSTAAESDHEDDSDSDASFHRRSSFLCHSPRPHAASFDSSSLSQRRSTGSEHSTTPKRLVSSMDQGGPPSTKEKRQKTHALDGYGSLFRPRNATAPEATPTDDGPRLEHRCSSVSSVADSEPCTPFSALSSQSRDYADDSRAPPSRADSLVGHFGHMHLSSRERPDGSAERLGGNVRVDQERLFDDEMGDSDDEDPKQDESWILRKPTLDLTSAVTTNPLLRSSSSACRSLNVPHGDHRDGDDEDDIEDDATVEYDGVDDEDECIPTQSTLNDSDDDAGMPEPLGGGELVTSTDDPLGENDFANLMPTQGHTGAEAHCPHMLDDHGLEERGGIGMARPPTFSVLRDRDSQATGRPSFGAPMSVASNRSRHSDVGCALTEAMHGIYTPLPNRGSKLALQFDHGESSVKRPPSTGSRYPPASHGLPRTHQKPPLPASHQKTVATPAPLNYAACLMGTPQQPVETKWGAQASKYGDWGVSKPTSQNVMQILRLRLARDKEIMTADGHISPEVDRQRLHRGILVETIHGAFDAADESAARMSYGAGGSRPPVTVASAQRSAVDRLSRRRGQSIAKYSRVSRGRLSDLGSARRGSTSSVTHDAGVGLGLGDLDAGDDAAMTRSNFHTLNIVGGRFTGAFDEHGCAVIESLAHQKGAKFVGDVKVSHTKALTLTIRNLQKSQNKRVAIFTHQKPSMLRVAGMGLLVSRGAIQPGSEVYYLPMELYQFTGVLEVMASHGKEYRVAAEAAPLDDGGLSFSARLQMSDDHSPIRPNALDVSYNMAEGECENSMDGPSLSSTHGGTASMRALEASTLAVQDEDGDAMVDDTQAGQPTQAVGDAHPPPRVLRSRSSATSEDSVSPLSLEDMETLPWEHMCYQMPWGCFLSEGAFKRVYRVVNTTGELPRQEAVSVMDVKQIRDLGSENVIMQELKVSLDVSFFVSNGICPNFVETYGVFKSKYEPPASIWGTEDNRQPRGGAPPTPHSLGAMMNARAPKKQTRRNASYQYIRMELCSQGDIEEYIRGQPTGLLPLATVVQMSFQMMFAMYVAQRELKMRHYDVKLLNFLLREIEPVPTSTHPQPLLVQYGVDDAAFMLDYTSPEAHPLWVKLADFGTADLDPDTLGGPVGLDQYTTLENTPIEQLLLGSLATQSFAADAWSLGLSLLHLYTGHMPYEELMEGVTCPEALADELLGAWMDPDNGEAFDVIKQVICPPDEDEEDMDELDHTLPDTLYRYLVLLGLPTKTEIAKVAAWKGNLIWKIVHKHIGNGSRSRSGHSATSLFKMHRGRWGIADGSEAVMCEARARLQQTGAMELLRNMLSLNPEERATMADALKSSAFFCLRQGPQYDGVLPGFSFMNFYDA